MGPVLGDGPEKGLTYVAMKQELVRALDCYTPGKLMDARRAERGFVNDNPSELRDAAQFVAHELGADTPRHISRFFPAYKMTDAPPTPIEALYRAREIGLAEGLKYIYVGNVPDGASQDTVCPACGSSLIRRGIFGVLANRVRDGHCPDCKVLIAGVGMEGR